MKAEVTGVLKEIVQYLNQKTGTSFRAASASTQKPIIARINEGYTADDFRAVIDEKSSQWLGNATMERYLRPQTLFGSKFESYLQEARRKTPKPHDVGASGFRNAKELLE